MPQLATSSATPTTFARCVMIDAYDALMGSLRSFARLHPIETEADTLRAATRLFVLGNLCGRQQRIDFLEEGLAFRIDELAVRGQRPRRNLHVRRSRFEATLFTRSAVEVVCDRLAEVAQHAAGARERGSVDGV